MSDNEQLPMPENVAPDMDGTTDQVPIKSEAVPAARARPHKGISIAALILLIVLLVGAAVYFMTRKGSAVPQKEDINAIHEREVQKAIQELSAEKQAKKKLEERKGLLRSRKAELQSLHAQLKEVSARRAYALSEVDDIRRPHLFRSRAKKVALLSEQLQIIDRLDAKSASLKARIAKCQEAIDTLSAPGKPND